MAGINKIEIYQVMVEKSDAGTYSISAYWTTQETPQPYQGNYHMEIESIAGTVASVDTEKKSGQISGVQLDLQTFYTLTVTADGKTDEAPILLNTYENAAGTYDGSVLKLSWDAPAKNIGTGICIVSVENGGSFTYDIPLCVRGIEIPFKEALYGENIVLTVSLQPIASKISSGPIVTLPELYCSRYIVSEGEDGEIQICYKGMQPDETGVDILLEGEIYQVDTQGNSKKPDAPVIAGPLTLGITAPYTLTIKTDTVLNRSDYDSFVDLVSGLVTTKAMYDILEMITRCAFQNAVDSLYFHCGLRTESEGEQENVNRRCADVRPGFALRLEQEMYMPNVQLSNDDAAGFVGTHTAEYQVSLAKGDSMQYLEFDSFIAQMDEDIYPPAGESAVSPAGGGIIDLCAVRMRAPFYRIQYPDAMYSSDMEPDIYEENHTLLVAEPGWKYVPSPTNYLLFRGRSAMTLLISVIINGIEKKVPVGTTFGKLLNSMGIYGLRKNEMAWYRRSPFGTEVRLFFEGDIVNELPLLHGDRIEG